jgi:hypothetical protein
VPSGFRIRARSIFTSWRSGAQETVWRRNASAPRVFTTFTTSW